MAKQSSSISNTKEVAKPNHTKLVINPIRKFKFSKLKNLFRNMAHVVFLPILIFVLGSLFQSIGILVELLVESNTISSSAAINTIVLFFKQIGEVIIGFMPLFFGLSFVIIFNKDKIMVPIVMVLCYFLFYSIQSPFINIVKEINNKNKLREDGVIILFDNAGRDIFINRYIISNFFGKPTLQPTIFMGIIIAWIVTFTWV